MDYYVVTGVAPEEPRIFLLCDLPRWNTNHTCQYLLAKETEATYNFTAYAVTNINENISYNGEQTSESCKLLNLRQF